MLSGKEIWLTRKQREPVPSFLTPSHYSASSHRSSQTRQPHLSLRRAKFSSSMGRTPRHGCFGRPTAQLASRGSSRRRLWKCRGGAGLGGDHVGESETGECGGSASAFSALPPFRVVLAYRALTHSLALSSRADQQLLDLLPHPTRANLLPPDPIPPLPAIPLPSLRPDHPRPRNLPHAHPRRSNDQQARLDAAASAAEAAVYSVKCEGGEGVWAGGDCEFVCGVCAGAAEVAGEESGRAWRGVAGLTSSMREKPGFFRFLLFRSEAERRRAEVHSSAAL